MGIKKDQFSVLSTLSLTSSVATLILVFITSKLLNLRRNYRRAYKTGFPVLVAPFPSQNVIWMIFGPLLRDILEPYLSESLFARLAVTTNGWEFVLPDLHEKLGKCFVTASLDGCSLWVADPEMCNIMLAKWKEFPQDPILERFLGWPGASLLTVNGNDWSRHRRIFSPNLNEQINASVWAESREQTVTMLDHLKANPGSDVVLGLREIAMNVLAHSGYAQSKKWRPESFDTNGDNKEGKEDESYFRALSLILLKQGEAALFPTWFLKMPFMPRILHQVASAVQQFPRLTDEMIDRERKMIKAGETNRSNFSSMLVQQSDAASNGSGGAALQLSDDEIRGNLFLFSAAGYEPTTNTMGLAVTLLAANPKYQDWMKHDLERLPSDIRSWAYEDVFPKCNRILAVMFETLRLFTPSLHALKSVNQRQTIEDETGTHWLSEPMAVSINLHAIHSSPKFYHPDPKTFRPSRWIDVEGNLITPANGTFVPWSTGARQCPGMKMAQVEFIAIFATLFRHARCEVILEHGQTKEQARAELDQLLKESRMISTMQVKDSKRVKLRWTS